LKKEQQQTSKNKLISQIEIPPNIIPGQKTTMASKSELIREQRASSFTKKKNKHRYILTKIF